MKKLILLLSLFIIPLVYGDSNLRETAFSNFIVEEKLRVGSTVAPTVAVDVVGAITSTDDTTWTTDGSGVLYGNMDQNGGVFTVTLGSLNQLYELDAATTNISAGELNDVTFDGDHYLEVNTAGRYMIIWSLIAQVNTLTGGSEHIEFEILKNGSAMAKGESHITFKNTVRDFPLGSNTIYDLAVDDEISIGATNRTSAGKIITIDHLEMSVFMLGGT